LRTGWRLARNTIIESTFEVGRRFRCTMRVNCGRGDPVGPRGMALGIAAQAFLVVVIIGYIMLFFGLELLDLAREVAVFNLPARVAHLFGVGV
jgi:hypothetical protein